MAQRTWVEFVAELARRWDVIERLMADHRSNAAGLCVECTTPGRGTPRESWPCPLWTLADAARQIRVQQKLRP
ncbi:hypothetical protein [Pseudonocardia adelaidensis]|uniref:Uncharacterized protein n=1 Tax=Pseudonocardia adelaidensis TaxID=648754 RepID=A0ABP9NRH9_9PSEU